MNYYSSHNTISNHNTDLNSYIVFTTDTIYSRINYFCYKYVELNYNIEKYENEIIQKGNEIVRKYLQGIKIFEEECGDFNNYINSDHINFILSKEKSTLRCYFINEIFKNPILGKYYFKYSC